MSGLAMNAMVRAVLVTGSLVLLAALCGCTGTGNDLEGAGFGRSLSPTGAPVADAVGAVSDRDPDTIRTVPDLPPPPGTDGGAEQLIARNDILKVEVFQVEELGREVQVDSRGNIALPLIGDIEAAGKTVRSLEGAIEALYGVKYLQSPDVSVFVKESFGQRVTVDGEVGKAGIHAVTPTSSLISALSQAGGLNRIADPAKVYVFRDYGDERLVARYNVSKIRSGRNPDPRIYGGDVIVVFSSATRVVMRNLREALGVARNARTFIP